MGVCGSVSSSIARHVIIMEMDNKTGSFPLIYPRDMKHRVKRKVREGAALGLPQHPIMIVRVEGVLALVLGEGVGSRMWVVVSLVWSCSDVPQGRGQGKPSAAPASQRDVVCHERR